jgi:hypothetical protein
MNSPKLPWRIGCQITKTNGWAAFDIYPASGEPFSASISFESPETAQAHVDFIQRACNNHDKLAAACRDAAVALDSLTRYHRGSCDCHACETRRSVRSVLADIKWT